MGADEQTRARIERLTSSVITDAHDKRGMLASAIQRVYGDGVIAGPAVTAACAEGSVSAMLRAIERAAPGDVVMIQGRGEWAYFGELAAAEAVRRGVVAVVVDGLTRDVSGLSGMGLSVFAHGTTPRGARPPGEGQIEVSLQVGETTVSPGDWIIGDDDGLVAVAASELAAVLDRAQKLDATEAAILERVRGGASLFEQSIQPGETLGELMNRGA